MLKSKIKEYYLTRILGKKIPISFNQNSIKSFLDAPVFNTPRVYCVINFDDLSPIPDSSRYIGRGGNEKDFVAVKQLELLKLFPFIGITHFTVPQFIPADYYYIFDKKHFLISESSNKTWLNYYKTLSEKYNFEFASHGFYHRQFVNPLFSRHTEFAYLNYKDSLLRIKQSIKSFEEVEIHPIGFRAPGWDMNSDLSLIDAIFESGLKYAGLSSYDGGLNSIKQRVSYYHPVFLKGIINFPDNINLDWPLNTIKNTIRKIVNLNGIISIKGHFCKHVLTNSLSEENFIKLKKTIEFLNSDYKSKVEFGTFKDAYEVISKSEKFLEYLHLS